MIKTYFKKDEWFGNIRGDILSGLVVALALIPEAIAFSIIAGVDPKIGLYASFCIAVVISFFGGRPGMISAATGAMSLLMVTLVKDYGLQYLLAATLLTGVFQIIAGYLQLGRFMSFVPRAVVIGFVNALAILIFMAQLPELINVTWHVYALTIVGLGIIYLFPYIPKIGKILPSPLVTIITLTLIVYFFGIDIRNVGDMGQLPDTLPIFLFPDIPLNLETLLIILPYSLSLAVVGLLESLMVVFLSDVISIIPMAALVAVMIMVSIGTFNWGSFKDLKTLPLSTNIVMLSTVAVTVYTHNLAFGVFTGVLLASLFFANKISHFMYSEIFYNDNKTIKTYKIVGQVFFNSADKFYKIFDFKENIDKVVIDLTRAHFWDVTAVYALDKSVLKLRKEGKEVEIIGQNEASSTIIDRFGIHDKPEEIDRIMGGH